MASLGCVRSTGIETYYPGRKGTMEFGCSKNIQPISLMPWNCVVILGTAVAGESQSWVLRFVECWGIWRMGRQTDDGCVWCLDELFEHEWYSQNHESETMRIVGFSVRFRSSALIKFHFLF